MSKSAKMVNSLLLDLPETALTEILARLPWKSLFTAKCVCKTFLRLISPLHSSYVIALHSANASQIRIYENYIGDSQNGYKIGLFLLDPEIDFGFRSPKTSGGQRQIRSPIPMDPDWTEFCISNSCNGLFHLTYILPGDDRHFKRSVVWNPLTNEYLELHTKETGDDRATWTSFRLGFSPRSNQYKVLKTLYYGSDVVKGRLLDVGSNSSSWRAIESTRSRSWSLDRFPTYLDGVIYWTIKVAKNFFIEFFDFDREEFGVMDLSDVHYNADALMMISVGLYQGCLCLCCYFSGHKMGMWVMEKGNWSRKFVVDMGRPCAPGSSPDLLKPVHVLRNGEILMLYGLGIGDILCVNPETNSLRYVKGCPFWINTGLNLTPTFVPLKDILKADNIKLLGKRNSAILTTYREGEREEKGKKQRANRRHRQWQDRA